MIPYYGDFAEDDTVNMVFNTFDSNDPSASVTITNLVDGDVHVHKDGGTTEATTDGATVALNFDGITGNHLVTIDTSAHAFYATGSEYQVRIEGTTVDAATINAFIGSFSIERAGGALALIKLIPTTAMRGTDNANTTVPDAAGVAPTAVENRAEMDSNSTQLAAIVDDTGQIGTAGAGLSNINLPNQTMDIIGSITGNLSGSVGSVTGAVGSVTGNVGGDVQGNLDGAVATTTTNTDLVSAASIADAVWNELTTDHIAVNTFGQRLSVSETGTAVAASGTTITLDAGSSELADFYNGSIIVITAGTGVGQSRIISDYAVTTNVATVDTWVTNPSTDSVYYIIPFGTIPGASAPTAGQVADAVWNEDATAHQTGGTFGQAIGDPGANAETMYDAVVTDAAGTNVAADIIVIESQTDDIGTAGAGLTAINLPNQTMDIVGSITGNLSGSVGSVTAEVTADMVKISGDSTAADNLEIIYQDLITGTAQSGANGSITLASAESFAADILIGATVYIISGTGAGQSRVIHDYGVAADRADISPVWTTNPTSSSVYVVFPSAPANTTEPASVNVVEIAGATVSTTTAQLGVNVVQVSGDANSADNLELDYDGTGYDKSNSTIGTTTTNTDMVGTNNAALASVLGALNDVAAVGNVTTGDTLMQYVKQQLNEISGSVGIGAMPTLADPANGINLFEMLRAAMGATFASATDSLEQLQADHVAIETDTGQIGTAGAGLSNINLPNQTMDITGNLSGSVGSVTAQVVADLTAISGDSTAADRLEALMDGTLVFQVNGGTPTTTSMIVDGDVNDATDGHYIGRLITGRTGANAGQQTAVTAYNGTTKLLTFDALTGASSNDDFWVMT